VSNFLQLVDRPIAFQRSFVRLGVGITGALLLSQIVYWQNRMEGNGSTKPRQISKKRLD
jgi:hypothetical protein